MVFQCQHYVKLHCSSNWMHSNIRTLWSKFNSFLHSAFFCCVLIRYECISIGRLLDVCHGQLERERQLVLFLVFEHLEEDLAGYLNRMGDRGMAPKTIQVVWSSIQPRGPPPKTLIHSFPLLCLCPLVPNIEIRKRANDWCRFFTHTSYNSSWFKATKFASFGRWTH